MTDDPIYVGNWGTVLEIAVHDHKTGEPIPLGDATTIEIILLSPRGVATAHPALLTSDGSDGLIEYTTQPGDIDAAGIWAVRGHVITPVGDWDSLPDSFPVEARW